ncbi:WD40 repeat domain-containing protein [Nonomuraea wenchangensis]|uniref:WD40 repeat domain-containing protein n=1 Tax=Nonomuraea wenchangensis TaxID=568860 RepID=UPI003430A932
MTFAQPSHLADLVVLSLDEEIPAGVNPAPLRFPLMSEIRSRPWWAHGFPSGDPAGNTADGIVGEVLGYGKLRLDSESRYHVKVGFSGAGLWSDDLRAVVGIVCQAHPNGDGQAISLSWANQRLEGEKLLELTKRLADQADEMALAAWGWELAKDPQARSHWRPKSRGVTRESELGYRFRGRSAALRVIKDWLDREDIERKALVITGSPGAGKSAVLGRIITTADRAIRTQLSLTDTAEKATVGSVACAVHAKGKTALEVAAEIARAANRAAPSVVSDLATVVQQAQAEQGNRRFNLIIDALDEATTPAEARTIVTSVVLPLVETCDGVRVVVGTRKRDDDGDLIRTFGHGLKIINLDDAEYSRLEDLSHFALATLQLVGHERPGNPYEAEAVARPVADRIAVLAKGNFLIAGLIARTYGLYDTVAREPDQVDFSADIRWALDDYLGRLPAVEGVPARNILGALAFAEAPGFTADLWTVVLRALEGFDIAPDRLSRFARSSAASFLMESSASAAPVFRLFHQALNDTLLAAKAEFHAREEDERRLTRAFIKYGGSAGWASAPDYLLRSLPLHAARGGAMDELLAVDEYPLHADLMRLIPVARKAATPQGKQRSRLLRSSPQAVAAEPPGERLGVMSIAEALDDLGDTYKLMPHPSPYRAMWARAEPRLTETVLTGHDDFVNGVCAMTLDDRTLLATTSSDRTVRVWDPATGTQIHALIGHTAEVTAICAFTIAGLTVLATSSMDKTIRIWDPASGANLRTYKGHTYGVTGLCTLTADGRILLVSTSDDRTARVWDPAARLCLHTLIGHTAKVTAACALTLDGRPLLATASQDRTIRLWDPVTGACLRTLTGHAEEITGHSHGVTSVCSLTVGGRPLLASTSRDRTVRLWDPATGVCLRIMLGHTSDVTDACALVLEGRTLLATTGGDRLVRIWDPATGEQIGSLGGHTDAVTTACTLTSRGYPLLATAGRDRTVHLWAADTGTLLRPYRPLPYGVTGLCLLNVDYRPVLVTTGRDSMIYLRDPETGDHVRTLIGHKFTVSSACVISVSGSTLLATTGDDETVRLWDPSTGECLHVLTGHDKGVTAACALGDVLATTGRDYTVRTWDPATGAPLHTMTGHTKVVTAACSVSVGGRIVLATASRDTTVRLWDPATGLAQGGFVAHERAELTGLCTVQYDHRELLVTTSRDKTAKLWCLASGDCLVSLRGHTDTVSAACTVILNGRTLLATSSYDRTVRLWDPATGSCLRVVPVQHEAVALCPIPGGVAVGLTAGVLAISLSQGEGERDQAGWRWPRS